MNADTQTIAMLSGVVIPIVVGILAKFDASSGVKAVLNFGLTALMSVLAEIIPGAFDWQPFLIAWLSAWAVSVATYYGLWKPTGTTQAVQRKTAGVGVG